jgi:hypothetical protein
MEKKMTEEKELRFLHVNTRITPDIVSAMEEEPKRSGMYNWFMAFGGDMYPLKEITDDMWANYDVVQINMSPVDIPLIRKARKKLDEFAPDTMLVLNNDYVCEAWDIAFGIEPGYYDEVQKMGDLVFSTEPTQVSNMIDGTFVLPHPTRVEHLKTIRAPEQTNDLGIPFHWWSGDTYIPSRTANKIKDKFGLDKTKLFAYVKKERDRMVKWHKTMWDETVGGMNYCDYAQEIASCKLIYEPCNMHTYGRNTVETACYRVPVIGSDRVYSMKMLYPFTICDPYDTKTMMELAEKVLTDDAFRKKVIDYAYEKVEYFNYENSKKRFLDALKIAKDRGGRAWYLKNG